MFLYSKLLIDVFSRGDGEALNQIDSDSSDSLSYRIYRIWIPTIFEIFSSLNYFLIGTEDKGFNEFLDRIAGNNHANHNFIIFHLVSTGFVGVLIVIKFWKKLFYSFYNVLSSKFFFKERSNIKLCLYALFTYFISINIMSTYNSIFMIFASVIICYSISLAQNIRRN